MKLLNKTCVLLALFITVAAFSDWQVQEEHWYGVTIDGAKSGWAQETLEVDGDLFKTSKVQNLSLSRGGMEITITVTTEFIETEDGEPVSVKSIQSAMGATSETLMEFSDTEIQMTSSAGGAPIVKTLPLPESSWLTPREVTKLFIEKTSKGDSDITYQTMSPELGAKIITVLMTKIRDDVQDILGKETPVSLWKTENDAMPIVGNEAYTKEGLSVSSSISTGFGNIVNVLMSKHEALSPINDIPELMVSLFVEPNKPITAGEDQSTLTLRVKSKDGSSLELPSSGAQRATANDDGTITLAIDINAPTAATQEELDDPIYLEATSICDGSDEAVASIAHDALNHLGADATDLEKALALRSKVFNYIDDKNMSTAFASASQTARDKKGDCSEHAVLLCGLLRSAGIPSRGVLGMVYVPNYGAPNGVFGWHMWSQALIEGKWIDLDATLQTSYHVGHIATANTTLADEELASEMATILSTIGNIDVEVAPFPKTSP